MGQGIQIPSRGQERSAHTEHRTEQTGPISKAIKIRSLTSSTSSHRDERPYRGTRDLNLPHFTHKKYHTRGKYEEFPGSDAIAENIRNEAKNLARGPNQGCSPSEARQRIK